MSASASAYSVTTSPRKRVTEHSRGTGWGRRNLLANEETQLTSVVDTGNGIKSASPRYTTIHHDTPRRVTPRHAAPRHETLGKRLSGVRTLSRVSLL
ncbi:hypothetical protein M3J09_011036 [Ascochyta lentis]